MNVWEVFVQRMHAAGILAKHHDDVTGRDISMCVSGYILVDCLLSCHLASDRVQAVRVCEKLVSMGKLQHATKRMRPFVDSRSELYSVRQSQQGLALGGIADSNNVQHWSGRG